MAPHTLIPSVVPKADLSIRLAESVVFLRGSIESTITGRRTNASAPPAMLRGLLTLTLSKPTKISSIELELDGRAWTSWPEGFGARRIDITEEHKILHAHTVYFQAPSLSQAAGTGSRRTASVGPGLWVDNEDMFSADEGAESTEVHDPHSDMSRNRGVGGGNLRDNSSRWNSSPVQRRTSLDIHHYHDPNPPFERSQSDSLHPPSSAAPTTQSFSQQGRPPAIMAEMIVPEGVNGHEVEPPSPPYTPYASPSQMKFNLDGASHNIHEILESTTSPLRTEQPIPSTSSIRPAESNPQIHMNGHMNGKARAVPHRTASILSTVTVSTLNSVNSASTSSSTSSTEQGRNAVTPRTDLSPIASTSDTDASREAISGPNALQDGSSTEGSKTLSYPASSAHRRLLHDSHPHPISTTVESANSSARSSAVDVAEANGHEPQPLPELITSSVHSNSVSELTSNGHISLDSESGMAESESVLAGAQPEGSDRDPVPVASGVPPESVPSSSALQPQLNQESLTPSSCPTLPVYSEQASPSPSAAQSPPSSHTQPDRHIQPAPRPRPTSNRFSLATVTSLFERSSPSTSSSNLEHGDCPLTLAPSATPDEFGSATSPRAHSIDTRVIRTLRGSSRGGSRAGSPTREHEHDRERSSTRGRTGFASFWRSSSSTNMTDEGTAEGDRGRTHRRDPNGSESAIVFSEPNSNLPSPVGSPQASMPAERPEPQSPTRDATHRSGKGHGHRDRDSILDRLSLPSLPGKIGHSISLNLGHLPHLGLGHDSDHTKTIATSTGEDVRGRQAERNRHRDRHAAASAVGDGWKEFRKGTYSYPISFAIPSTAPPTLACDFGAVTYKLKATVHRPGTFTSKLTCTRDVTLIAAPGEDDLEERDDIVVQREWDQQLGYGVVISGRGFPIGSRIPLMVNFVPMCEGVKVWRVNAVIEEKVSYYTQFARVARTDPTRRFELIALRSSTYSQTSQCDEPTPLLPLASPDLYPSSPLYGLIPATTAKEAGQLAASSGGPWTLQTDLQLPRSCARMHFTNKHKRSNIGISHVLKVILRVERGDDEYVDTKTGKRKMFDIVVQTPIHILSCRCNPEWMLLPRYTSFALPDAQSKSLSCPCTADKQRRKAKHHKGHSRSKSAVPETSSESSSSFAPVHHHLLDRDVAANLPLPSTTTECGGFAHHTRHNTPHFFQHRSAFYPPDIDEDALAQADATGMPISSPVAPGDEHHPHHMYYPSPAYANGGATSHTHDHEQDIPEKAVYTPKATTFGPLPPVPENIDARAGQSSSLHTSTMLHEDPSLVSLVSMAPSDAASLYDRNIRFARLVAGQETESGEAPPEYDAEIS